MSFTIDKGVPLPPKPTNGGRTEKYPCSKMEVGDSFFAANAKRQAISSRLTAASRVGKGTFTTRTITENGVAGVRVWRTA